MRKGISALVTVILLLFITFSLGGFLYLYFTGWLSSLVTMWKGAPEEKMVANLRVEAISGTNIVIRNTGQVELSDFSVYVDGVPQAIVSQPSSLAPKATGMITIQGIAQGPHTLKITTVLGGMDTVYHYSPQTYGAATTTTVSGTTSTTSTTTVSGTTTTVAGTTSTTTVAGTTTTTVPGAPVNLSSYNGVLTTDGNAQDTGYSISKTNSNNCGQGTCDDTTSWDAGFTDNINANTQIDWYFNVSAFGITGSQITSLIVTGGGCWCGEVGAPTSCGGTDDAEFTSGQGNMNITIYNWNTGTFDIIGTSYYIGYSGSSNYRTYQEVKTSGFVNDHISPEGIVRIRYWIYGDTLGSGYDVVGVYDFSFLTIYT